MNNKSYDGASSSNTVQKFYKVYLPLYKGGKLVGHGVMEKDFDSLQAAKIGAREEMLSTERVYHIPYIREYEMQSRRSIIIGGEHELIDESKPYIWATQDSGKAICYYDGGKGKWEQL